MKVDLRAATVAEFDTAVETLQRVVAQASIPGTTGEALRVSGHAPMEKSPATARLVALAQDVAHEHGLRPVRRFDRRGKLTPTPPPAWGCPPSTAWDRSVATITPPTSGSTSSSIVPRVALLAGLIARASEGVAPSASDLPVSAGRRSEPDPVESGLRD